jgi:hypothetical protein
MAQPTLPIEVPVFVDEEFMTAAEKVSVLKAWTRFLRHGLDPKHFTRALYKHLINHASFIAHWDQGGFAVTYFTTPHQKLQFLTQFWTGRSVEYGSQTWLEYGTATDLNRALCAVARQMRPELEALLLQAVEAADLATADALERQAAALRARHAGA